MGRTADTNRHLSVTLFSMEFELSAAALGIVPVVMALTSLSKSYVPPKGSPIVAMVLSLLASFFLIPTGDLTTTIVQGVVMALAASGLYSGGKTLGSVMKK